MLGDVINLVLSVSKLSESYRQEWGAGYHERLLKMANMISIFFRKTKLSPVYYRRKFEGGS